MRLASSPSRRAPFSPVRRTARRQIDTRRGISAGNFPALVSVVVVSRLPPLRRDDLDPARRELWDSIVGTRDTGMTDADGGLNLTDGHARLMLSKEQTAIVTCIPRMFADASLRSFSEIEREAQAGDAWKTMFRLVMRRQP